MRSYAVTCACVTFQAEDLADPLGIPGTRLLHTVPAGSVAYEAVPR